MDTHLVTLILIAMRALAVNDAAEVVITIVQTNINY